MATTAVLLYESLLSLNLQKLQLLQPRPSKTVKIKTCAAIFVCLWDRRKAVTHSWGRELQELLPFTRGNIVAISITPLKHIGNHCCLARKKEGGLASSAQLHRGDGPTSSLGPVSMGREQRAVCSGGLVVAEVAVWLKLGSSPSRVEEIVESSSFTRVRI